MSSNDGRRLGGSSNNDNTNSGGYQQGNNRYYSSSNNNNYNNNYNRYNNNNNGQRYDNRQQYNNSGGNDRNDERRLYSDYNQRNDNRQPSYGQQYGNSGGYKQNYKQQRNNPSSSQSNNFYFAMERGLNELAENNFYEIQVVPLENAFNGNYNDSITLYEYISNFHLYNLYSNLLSRHDEISKHISKPLSKFLGIIPRLEVELERSLAITAMRKYQRDLLKEKLDRKS